MISFKVILYTGKIHSGELSYSFPGDAISREMQYHGIPAKTGKLVQKTAVR